jgi:hypothetical protein
LVGDVPPRREHSAWMRQLPPVSFPAPFDFFLVNLAPNHFAAPEPVALARVYGDGDNIIMDAAFGQRSRWPLSAAAACCGTA